MPSELLKAWERRQLKVEPNSQPVQPGVATPPPNPVVPNIVQSSSSSSNKNMMWILVAIVLAVLAVGGLYFYMKSKNSIASIPSQQTVVQTSNQVTPTPVNLDSDLSNINVASGEADFTPVDSDLKNL